MTDDPAEAERLRKLGIALADVLNGYKGSTVEILTTLVEMLTATILNIGCAKCREKAIELILEGALPSCIESAQASSNVDKPCYHHAARQ